MYDRKQVRASQIKLFLISPKINDCVSHNSIVFQLSQEAKQKPLRHTFNLSIDIPCAPKEPSSTKPR